MELIQIIKEPYFNKKRTSLSANRFVLPFVVDKKANKVMIKQAFHSFFGVKALSVNTLVKHPKPTRITKQSRKNYTKAKKIAFVSLSKEDFLNLKRTLEGDVELLEQELEAMKAKVTDHESSIETESIEAKEVKVEEEPKAEKKKIKKASKKESKADKKSAEDKQEEVKEDSETNTEAA